MVCLPASLSLNFTEARAPPGLKPPSPRRRREKHGERWCGLPYLAVGLRPPLPPPSASGVEPPLSSPPATPSSSALRRTASRRPGGAASCLRRPRSTVLRQPAGSLEGEFSSLCFPGMAASSSAPVWPCQLLRDDTVLLRAQVLPRPSSAPIRIHRGLLASRHHRPAAAAAAGGRPAGRRPAKTTRRGATQHRRQRDLDRDRLGRGPCGWGRKELNAWGPQQMQECLHFEQNFGCQRC